MGWKDLFEQKILKRGSEYCTNRAVLNLKVTENKITAVVNGSDLYQVEINLINEEVVDMHCSCPYAQNGKNCKHMAAVLYKWERNKEFAATEHVESVREEQEKQREYDENFLDRINWGFYGQYYPDKFIAIKELRLNTDMSMTEAKEIIDELFKKIESINPDFNKGKVQPKKSQPRKAYNTSRYNSPYTKDVYGHKRTAYKSSSSTNTKSNNKSSNNGSSGCCLVSLFLLIFYMPFRVIFGLTKKYY